MKQALKSLAFVLVGACVMLPAHSAPPAPLGLVIGVTSCDAGLKVIGAKKLQRSGASLEANSQHPEALYPGAASAGFVCVNDKVEAVLLTVNKGGMGNPAGKELYKTLKSKYKQVIGGPIASVGDSFARFEGDGAVVQLVSPHLSFQVSLLYVTKAYFAAQAAAQESQDTQQQQVKASKL